MFQPSSAARAYRVLHVLFSPRMAGSERYCVDLANRQAALGHEVHVAGRPRSLIAAALAPNVHYHPMKLPVLRGWRLRRMIGQLGIDICHGHLSHACKSLAEVPEHVGTVATLHVGYKAHQHSQLDGLICVNQAQANRLETYRGESKIISNWLPAATTSTTSQTTPRAQSPRRSSLRAQLGLPADAFVIGAVGRLHASKGADVLVKAFLATAPEHAELVILGEGPQRAELEQLCAHDRRVHLLGHRDDVLECLQEFDLFVSPSREESFGLAIIEAMSQGLPLIATATEGPSEILRDQPVTLVAPDSVQALSVALAQALDRLGDRPGTRLNYDLSRFDAAPSVSEISAFYTQVLDARARPNPQPQLQIALQVQNLHHA